MLPGSRPSPWQLAYQAVVAGDTDRARRVIVDDRSTHAGRRPPLSPPTDAPLDALRRVVDPLPVRSRSATPQRVRAGADKLIRIGRFEDAATTPPRASNATARHCWPRRSPAPPPRSAIRPPPSAGCEPRRRRRERRGDHRPVPRARGLRHHPSVAPPLADARRLARPRDVRRGRRIAARTRLRLGRRVGTAAAPTSWPRLIVASACVAPTLVTVPIASPDASTHRIARRHAARPADVEHPQRRRRLGAAAVHPFDQFLAGIAALREVHRHARDAGDRRMVSPGTISCAHRRPSGGDPVRPRCDGRRSSPASIESSSISASTRILNRSSRASSPAPKPASMSNTNSSSAGAVDARQHVDLAGRLEHERPGELADRQGADVLGDLRLEIRERVGPLTTTVSRGPRIESGRSSGSMHSSLSWHTDKR